MSTIEHYLTTLRDHGFTDKDMVCEPQDTKAYCADWRGLLTTTTPAVLLPRNTKMVQSALRIANDLGVPITPQGGNTGLVFGSIPLSGQEVVISLKRMNHIRALDQVNATITVDAGCVLQDIKDAVDAAGLFFPLSLGAKGSCQIGGNLSTNAGGINVLRYGNARAQCLGIEAVLADGRTVSTLSGLRKDNRGIDLRQIFIGSEGTLGIITGAALQLYPKPKEHVTFAIAMDNAADAMTALQSLRAAVGDQVTSFEIISQPALAAVEKHSQIARLPFGCPAYMVLGEVSLCGAVEAQRDAVFQHLLDVAETWDSVRDVIVAQSTADRDSLWQVREEVVLCQKAAGPSIKHDVSVPLSAIPALFDRGMALAREIVPGCTPAPFGHAGDGNLHFNITAPEGWSTEAFFAHTKEMNRAIHGLVHELGGSFSAEHGIGSQKRDELPERLDADTLSVMRTLKDALDPKGILNPGKLFQPKG